MNVTEIIEQFEKLPNFVDNPEVKALVGVGRVCSITQVRQDHEDDKTLALLLTNHACPEPESADRYYWNGKLLDAMDRDELQAALVMMLNQTPVAKIAVSAPEEKPAKAQTGK